MKKLGLAIALGKDANSHTRTFIEAINYSLKHFPEFKKNTLKIVNDEKSPAGGKRAAIELIEWGAKVVVGHFSSFAALAALPLYIRQSIPLILPASTARELGKYNKVNRTEVLKYQKDDAALMAYCVDDSIINCQGGNVYAVVQDNPYANHMIEHLPLLADVRVIRELPEQVEKEDSFILIGYSDFASAIIKRLSQTQIYRILLVDDSDSVEVYNSCLLRPQRLSRVRSASHISRHGMIRPYWNETLLALSLACSIAPQPEAASGDELSFSTYLGLQYFDKSNCYGDCVLVSDDLD
ncbi:ABC transporter substrate-binding protein [Serratia ficaria]|uniref:Leucine-binding protein domain-containing protein n=1 Tax=Serratia ficaria TaxID=61651 RepID=A0A240BRB1_SERFI|nr:ABC transporter substrate-binding protein [Serratia ficaria]REF45625.1 hypothetical protein C7332_3968 [Serratia ficaria]CAI0866709.1 Uncharacterised protein [Serratia ficaria]CAI0915265.1 Uncharacterised protein [Serratia ficaria]CAI0966820.1 Uncharacterised protein [Serratia ficaria]CAI2027608.1 Uncharacterised protein [Serratia ficaria]